MSIEQVQNGIVDDFSILGDDREATIFYIMELGQKLPDFPEEYRVEENLIKGCMSKVWLHTQFDNGVVRFLADSNTEITKGLISLLIRVLDCRSPQEILNTDLDFIGKIGMSGLIGSQRSNGFTSMIKQMKLYALAYQSKVNAN